ncbi:SMP-30/gluconolactonase/LRE family protein [Specibacter sp. RAF43]|uniref:SMP-30/gluconolactonase/LRE family protein n=1 Tax=Specibacter sp. RAF43 TaxID=3233057 RepID=UPI003F9655FF
MLNQAIIIDGGVAMKDMTVIARGIGMGESARWHGGRFWYADWINGKIHAVDADGTLHQTIPVPSFPITFDWLPDGHLLIVSGSDARLLSLTPQGVLEPAANLRPLSASPWNEVVTNGANAYVNCIGFTFPGPPEVAGLIALLTPDGGTRVVADGLAFPNGMVIVNDGGTLVVAESHAGCLTAFDIRVDGSLANRRVWAEVPGSAPDGICVGDGGLWYADVPKQHCVLVAEGGEILRTVQLEQGCFSCVVGGDDADTLFILAATWPDVMNPAGPPTGRAVAVHLGFPGR